jgi:hypothetical protein
MKSLKFEGNQKANVIAPLLLMAFLVLVFPWGSAFGQAITGTLIGTVHDSSGAVVANVKIAVTNTATGISKQTVTNSYGDYVVPYLPPGHYDVTASMTGFQTAISKDNLIQVALTMRIDLTLSPGTVNQSVTVVAAAPLVQSTTSSLGTVVASAQIEALPLNGRLFSQLVGITPGAVQRGYADFAGYPAAAGAVSPITYTVNGVTWSGNLYMIDGIHDSEPLNAFISYSPPLDAIQEFQVQTNNPNAEYGQFGGAIVNLTIKSGTNQLHGDLFEYVRNEKLNAMNFFAVTKAPWKANQFGAALGGPIQKNKLFFFMDYQGFIQRQGVTNVLTVPTALQRQGVFTEGNQNQIYNPITGIMYANKTITPTDINPIAKNVVNLYPTPITTGLVSNYTTNTVNSENVNQWDLKTDLQATQRDHIFARESLAHRNFNSPSPGDVFMSGGPDSNSQTQNAVLGWDRTITPSIVNQFRIGFNRYSTHFHANDVGINENNNLGIPNGNYPGLWYTTGVATFSIPGISSIGDPGTTDSQRLANIYEFTDNVTVIHGKHTLGLGADLQKVQATLTNPQVDPRGIFSFNGSYTSNQGASGTGIGFASFLLGYPEQVQRDFVNTIPDVLMTNFGTYGQDNYRITRKLTLNLGFRWDLFARPVEKYNRQSNFDPYTGYIVTAQPGNRGPNVDDYLRNFAPRIGLAYSPDSGKTAFRAAYGLSYFPDNFGANGGTLERDYPFFTITNLQTPTTFTPFRSLSDGLPALVPVTIQPVLAPPGGFGVFYVPNDYRQDTIQMWNASIERQVTSTMMAEVAYVSTRGSRLYRDLQINTPFPGPGALAQRRPYYAVAPGITTIDERTSSGFSTYEALQAKVVKRTSVGLTFLAAYAFSKCINDTLILFPYLDNLNRGLCSGFSTGDIPQNFSFSYSYQLPFGQGRRWLGGAPAVVSQLVGGWSLNGITALQSGDPLVISVASSLLNTGTGNYANLNCSQVSTPHQVHKWFDSSCFSDPPQYAFGNSGIGHVRGPGLVNFDFAISKSTQWSKSETRRVEFRADFFNLSNTPHFSDPGTTLDTSSIGVISSTVLPPREIQLGLKLTF